MTDFDFTSTATTNDGGFLNDLGIKDWSQVGGAPVPGTYKGNVVAEIIVGTKKDPSARNLVLTYTVTESGDPDQIGKEIQEWKRINPPNGHNPNNPDDVKKLNQQAYFLKVRLLELGIPEDRINQITPADLNGPCVFSVKQTGDYTNIQSVKRGAVGAASVVPGEVGF